MPKPRFSRSDTKTVKNRIEVARQYYSQTFETRDKAHLNLYVGQHWKELGGAEGLISSSMDNVTENHIGRDIDLKVAGLAAEPPVFRFKPRGISHRAFAVRETLARVWEVYIPYIWREGDVHRQMKAALRDRYIFGRGWVGIDWKIETDDRYSEGARPDGFPGRILYDNPIVRRVSPKRLLLDPNVDTLNWEDAGFITWEMTWPLDRVRKWAKSDDRVNSSVANKLKGDDYTDPKAQTAVTDTDPTIKGEDFRKATIWRYHERDRNLVIYIAKEHPDEVLWIDENPYDFEGYPFEPIWGRPWIDKYDAVGYSEQMRPWQRLRNLSRSKMAQMMRTARHLLVLPNTLSEDDRQALETDLDRVMVFIDPGGQMQPRELNTTGFPPEILQAEPIMQTAHTELSGITALRRGMVEPGLDTATETQALVSQSGVGDRDEQADWEDFNRRVARKSKSLIEQLGEDERMAAVSPDVAKGLEPAVDELGNTLVDVQQGQRFTWVKMTPQQIVDEAEVEVVAGSMGAREEALERAQVQGATRTILEIAQAAPLLEAMGIDPQEFAKMNLETFGTNKINRIWQTPKPLPPGMVPASIRPAPQNGQPNLQEMLKSVVQSAEPGQGSLVGGGA